MPCNSDYLNPNQTEINSLAVLGFLKELGYRVGKYDKFYGRVSTLNNDVVKLCSACQKVNISKYSLELQIWWRDHQKADKKRIEKEIEEKKKQKDKKELLDKLTPYEKKLLNL